MRGKQGGGAVRQEGRKVGVKEVQRRALDGTKSPCNRLGRRVRRESASPRTVP